MRIFTKAGVLATVLAILGGAGVQAATVSTVPEGYVTLNIAAGTGTSRTISVISLPLAANVAIDGAVVGTITGISSNTFTNSAAGWTSGQLSAAATPCAIRVTTGNAKGRVFLISTSMSNTSTTVTIDAEEATHTNLTSLGIVAGTDKYEIISCDTVSGVFGTPATTGIQGGDVNTSDWVQIFISGAWRQYYYSTTSNAWLRVGPNTNSNNVPIRPDSAVMFHRMPASGLNLIVTGRVPSIDRKAVVSNSGVTFLANGWPTDLTLASSEINNLSGWVSNANPSLADIVMVMSSGAWRQYYHNGTQWLRVGPNTPSNTVSLPAGSGIMITKKGSASGISVLNQALPYTLN